MSSSQIQDVDYIVLALILFISIFIGLYHGFKRNLLNYIKSRRQINNVIEADLNKPSLEAADDEINSKISSEEDEKIETRKSSTINNTTQTSDYLIANSSMSTLPIAVSLLASFYSATTLIGMPAEVYQYGIQYWIIVIAQAFSPVVGALITGPFFAKLNILSIFEYFEMRYDSKYVRLVGMTFYLIRNAIACAIFIFGPATSLAILARLDENICIGMIGLIGTFYTTVGGIKGSKFIQKSSRF
jgi:hypothetical protein